MRLLVLVVLVPAAWALSPPAFVVPVEIRDASHL